MATKVTMPQMGFDMTEGKVARWLKKAGDYVTAGEPIVELETEKIECSPAAVLADVVAMMHARAEAKGLALHATCAGPIPLLPLAAARRLSNSIPTRRRR